MIVDWDSLAAGKDGKSQLIYALDQLAQTKGLNQRGNAIGSIKINEYNLYGEPEVVLWITNGQRTGCKAAVADLIGLHFPQLIRFTGLEAPEEIQIRNELACSRLNAGDPIPPEEAWVHAVLSAPCILSYRVDPVLAITLAADGRRRLQELFGEAFFGLTGEGSGFYLAQKCLMTQPGKEIRTLNCVLLPDGSLLAFGETPHQAFMTLMDLANKAEDYLKKNQAWDLPEPVNFESEMKGGITGITVLRKNISESAGRPLIVRRIDGLNPSGFSKRTDWKGESIEITNPVDPDAVISWSKPGNETVSRLILDATLGWLAAGVTGGEVETGTEFFSQYLTAILRAEKLQGFPLTSVSEFLKSLTPHFQSLPKPEPDETNLFNGEIGLVTGGASGIGKACVESLLKRGAAVVSLDINPRVVNLIDSPNYLGMVCDLTDEAAILKCFEVFTRHFGGLDMLVLNAGIFPAGIRIEALDTATWQKVMRINLDSNLVIMREAYPLLKNAPRYGRMLVNASKNVLAPGAGAAAYSASKSAVTQMARVAALEWGKDKIRVNIIHPDAIFDTGIWTEEVLKVRAAHYGMTVQQYKTRNVLGVELNSHYVGELVAAMLGPLFEKITGAQIPVDGGSDRVI
jgi:NAD(P)-dependent dehydrogenase (short-subunit alcohol dehydrogenase family)/rhamnose utilization protein RhaD (predicted bifunctional aldolase and dehydrogenase)